MNKLANEYYEARMNKLTIENQKYQKEINEIERIIKLNEKEIRDCKKEIAELRNK